MPLGRYGYRLKRSMLLVFWHQQRLLQNIVFHLYFGQNLPTLQRDLCAIAQLLVSHCKDLSAAPIREDLEALTDHSMGKRIVDVLRTA